ncbi:MAG: hypothetical protein QOH81_2054 [Sphingomonadales bacterium]|nr:hypothetical protein [Sphingomonadales bacterium]
MRVAGVAYQLSLANRRLCRGALAPQLGFVLHGIEQYGAADRPEAARRFGLASYVGVMAVVAGSPAQRSGLAADDQLVSVNGRALSAATASAAPTRAQVERAQHILAEEMGTGAVRLRVSGANGLRDVRFTAEAGCASSVELATGEEVNAWADGQRVVVSDGMVEQCGTDGDLALVIAHELAHNLLHHSRRLAAGGSVRRLRLTGSGSVEMRETEEEADRLGVRLARAAAYDLSDAVSFLDALLQADGAGRAATTHPAPARRLALLRAAIAAAGVGRGL